MNSLREGRKQTETSDVDVSNLTSNHVMVPRISFLPCSSLQRAMNTINPLESVSDNGLSLYFRAIEMCGSHLSSGCTQCMLANLHKYLCRTLSSFLQDILKNCGTL